MNKKSKEIVKKLCFTLVVVISIISIIGCPNTVSSKANGTSSSGGSTGGGDDPKPDPVKDTIEAMKIKGNDDPIVHSKDGLSFGWRENKLCLLSTEDHYPAGSNDPNYPLNEAFKKIKDEIGDEGVAFIPTSFDSVSDGLEKRWIAARKTKRKEGGKWLLFSSRSTSELDGYLTSGLDLPNGSLKNVGFFEFNNISQRFAVDKNKDIIVFITDDLTTHFADWHLVFVERVEDLNPDKIPEMYSFHYGPYTLKNKRNEDPDLHVPNY